MTEFPGPGGVPEARSQLWSSLGLAFAGEIGQTQSHACAGEQLPSNAQEQRSRLPLPLRTATPSPEPTRGWREQGCRRDCNCSSSAPPAPARLPASLPSALAQRPRPGTDAAHQCPSQLCLPGASGTDSGHCRWDTVQRPRQDSCGGGGSICANKGSPPFARSPWRPGKGPSRRRRGREEFPD